VKRSRVRAVDTFKGTAGVLRVTAFTAFTVFPRFLHDRYILYVTFFLHFSTVHLKYEYVCTVQRVWSCWWSMGDLDDCLAGCQRVDLRFP